LINTAIEGINLLKAKSTLVSLGKKAGWAVAENSIHPIVQIALTPVLLGLLGQAEFGLWLFAMAIVGASQLSSLGIGSAIIKALSTHLSNGEQVQAIAKIKAGIAITLIAGFVIFALTILFGDIVVKAFFKNMGDENVVIKLIVGSVAVMLVQEVDGVFTSGLKGAQRFDLLAKIEFIVRFPWVVGVLIAAYTSRSAVTILWTVFFILLFKSLVKAYYLGRLLNSASIYIPSFVQKDITALLAFGRWQWLQSVGGFCFSVLDKLLVGSFFGASELARYSICIQIAQYALTGPGAATQVLFPWLSSKTTNKTQFATNNFLSVILLTGLACVSVSIILAISANFILTVWISPDFAQNNTTLLISLLAAYGLMALNSPVHYCLMGLNKIKYLCLMNIFAGITMASAALFVMHNGIIAVALTKLTFGLIITINIFILKKELNALRFK
jgi:O-antigen/teichoic acid export membrane protein